MKKLYLLFIFLALFPLFAQTDTSKESSPNVIFLWDLHHVILKPRNQFRTVLKYPHKARALKNIRLQGKVWKLLLKGIFKEPSSDHFIILLMYIKTPI